MPSASWLEYIEVIVVRQVTVMAEGKSGTLYRRGIRSTSALNPLCRGPGRAWLAEMSVPLGLSHSPVFALESAATIAIGPTTSARQEVLGSMFGHWHGGWGCSSRNESPRHGAPWVRLPFQPAPSPLDSVQADVRLGGAALVPAGASTQAAQRQGEPQRLPELGAGALGLLPLPGDKGDRLLQLEDAGVGALQWPVLHHDELGGDGVLAHDAQLELQEADALLCQVIRTQDHDHPAAPLDEVKHGFSGI